MENHIVSFKDRVIGTVLLASMFPALLTISVIRKLLGKSHYSLRVELILSYGRNLGILPLSFRRGLGRADFVGSIRRSRRFANVASRLCERVSQSDFSGYWVCRGGLRGTSEQDRLCHSDITVLWIHGGGYITGHPLENVAQTLRIAEIGSERRTTIDVFALQYTLAPEAVMPRQMDQAIAAYRYLVSDMKIDPTRIVVMAASAGAHLALSLLYGLAAAGEACSGKAMLLYPWVNLDNSGRSFEDNQNKDALSKKELDCNVRWLLGPHGRHKFPYLVNFATSAQPNGLTWSKILPPATWITIGSHDVLLSDTERFVAVATADGAAVDFEVAEGLPHGWLGYIDQKAAQRYLDTPPTEDVVSIMPGAEICAKKLLEFAQERNMEI